MSSRINMLKMKSSKKCFICMASAGQTRLFSMFSDKSLAANLFHELTDVELKESTIPTLICQRCLMDLGNAVRSKRTCIRSHSRFVKYMESKSGPSASSQIPDRSRPPSTSTQLSLETVLKSIPKGTTVTQKIENKPTEVMSKSLIKDEVMPSSKAPPMKLKLEHVVEDSEVKFMRLVEVDDGKGAAFSIGFDLDIPRHEIDAFVSSNYGDVAVWTDQAN